MCCLTALKCIKSKSAFLFVYPSKCTRQNPLWFLKKSLKQTLKAGKMCDIIFWIYVVKHLYIFIYIYLCLFCLSLTWRYIISMLMVILLILFCFCYKNIFGTFLLHCRWSCCAGALWRHGSAIKRGGAHRERADARRDPKESSSRRWRWWWWRCSIIIIIMVMEWKSTWSRRMSGTETCCWTPPGRNSRGRSDTLL